MSVKLAIELDGFSHDLRQHYDTQRDEPLQKLGWVTLRFSNEDIQNNLEGVILTIIAKVKEIKGRTKPN